MTMLKNERHEQFVREYIKLGTVNASEAYRRAIKHYGRPLTHWNSAAVISGKLLKRPDVQKRCNELRQQMAKRADITVDKILTDYAYALEMAKAQERPDLIVGAATAQAKLVGLLKDRIETGTPGEFDALENVSEILEHVAAEAGPEVALALSKAMGVTMTENPAAPAQQEPEQEQPLMIHPMTDTVN